MVNDYIDKHLTGLLDCFNNERTLADDVIQ